MNPKLPVTVLVVAGALAIDPGTVSAESSVGLDLSIFTREMGMATATMFAPTVHARVRLGESVLLGVDWTLPYLEAFAEAGGMSSSVDRMNLGNPFFAAYHRMTLSSDLELEVGGGIALPISNVPDDDFFAARVAFASYAAALGARGLRDAWLVLPECLSLVLPARFDFTSGPLVIGVDFAVGLVVSTGNAIEDDTSALMQLSPRVGFRIGPVTVGTRLAEVLLSSDNFADKSQLSVEPFVEAAFASLKVVAAFNVNIDEPVGFSFDDGGMWGFTIGASATF